MGAYTLLASDDHLDSPYSPLLGGRPRGRRQGAVIGLFIVLSAAIGSVLTVLVQLHYKSDAYQGTVSAIPQISPRDLAANATLGFEKILALSQGTPWRINGLHAAANFTGLQIDVPPQPPISEALVEAFSHLGRGEDVVHPPRGAAFAWMAHLNILEHVIQSGLTTALIVEDDVDWDTRILEQMPLVSDGVRNFTKASSDDPEPYGGSWDVLWLGHCGNVHDSVVDLPTWPDDTVIPHEQYSGWAAGWLENLPEGVRSTNPTTFTVCSFAYAVSLEGAAKVVTALNHGNGEAFDIALMAACRDKPEELRCFTVTPEVFHQYVPPEIDGASSEVESGNQGSELAPATALEMHMGSTNNIVNSTRCFVLWNSQCIGNTWT